MLYFFSCVSECGFEIFTIGVGLNIDHFMLSQIASTPYLGHVFLINEMADLGRIAEIISEKNIGRPLQIN